MEVVERFKQAAALYREAEALMASGPLAFYLEQTAGFMEYAKNNLAKFKVDEAVVLVWKPRDDEYRGVKVLRKKFPVGKVTGIKCDPKGFIYNVNFPEDEHYFPFRDTKLKKVEEALTTTNQTFTLSVSKEEAMETLYGAAMECDPVAQSVFWIVWNSKPDHANFPTTKHESYQLAFNEAKRLADKYPNQTFYIMVASAGVRSETTMKKVSITHSPDQIK